MTEVISRFLDDDDVEWRTRPIKFWGVVKGLLGQLSLGQELTKVSIPAELSEPYSGLELTGARNLGNMNHLFELEGCSPLERMLAVIRFYISGIKEETFARKPFNPLLGEVHLCHSHSEEHGLTSLYSEQCEHHPPIAAVHVHNSKYGVTVENNTIFSVKFHGTWAGIYPSGQVRVQIGKEMYIISKVLPDLHIRNILPFSGRRKTIWTDDSVTITCESTGLSVNLHYQEKKSRSYLKGVIRQGLDPDSEATHKFRGYCSGKYTLIDLASGQRTCLLESEPDSLPMEYPSFEDMDPMESIRIWKEVNAAIIANDMPAANHAKTKIEAEQRARRQAGADLQPRFFKKVNGMWTYDGRTQREKEEDQKRREDKEKEKEREKERQGEAEGVRERKGTKARLQGLVRRSSRGGANLPATEDESSSSEEEQKEKRSRGSIKSPKAIVNGMRAKRQSVKVQNEEDSDKEVEDVPDRTTSPCQSGSGPVGFVKNLLNRSKTDANEGELSEEEEEGPERTTSPGPVAFVKNLLSRSNENVAEDKEKDKEREIPERTTSPPAHPHIPSAGVMFMRNLLGRGPTNRPSDPNPTPTGDVAEESEVTSSAYDSI